MHSRRVVNQIDVRRVKTGRRRTHNVTIKNIVTVDGSRKSSRHSEESDYDRAKFLIEERSKYWRNLKVLHNDYSLVKQKQVELAQFEDNYVNKHCIEETQKLANALKEKIQAQCKDIVFITNLFGDSEVNPVVQSLADGEDIDEVLLRKQKAQEQTLGKKSQSTHCLKKKHVSPKKCSKSEQFEEDEKPIIKKSTQNEPKFLDSELHWCQACNVFPPTIKKYLQHLHDESHKKKIKELRINEHPWHKCLPEEQAWKTDSTDTVKVKAFNFFVPVNGWFCTLCRSWMGDIHCVASHLRSYVHNMNLKTFQDKFPEWKQKWIDERSNALGKTFECRKDVDFSIESKSKVNKSDESDADEEPSEAISRHRNVKPKMWVPNQKAFERVCNEINNGPAISEPEPKLKFSKKDRPAFIGKMPLITSINKTKKIVVKDLPSDTSEHIASTCAAYDMTHPTPARVKETSLESAQAEMDELKLKKFMKTAKKINKAKKKLLEMPTLAELYSAPDYIPVVENTDSLDNIVDPAAIAQWEADEAYKYHMRYMANYQPLPPFMYMPQPQTYLLDPYHAAALHNQQFYSANMISNQYENFEIISMDDEQALSQYAETPNVSPTVKMFKSKKNCKENENSPRKKRSIQSEESSKTKSDVPLKKIKKSTSVISKPPKLIDSYESSKPAPKGALPSFTESFFSNASEIASSGLISSLLSRPDVKIVSTNKLYKKRMCPSKKRMKEKRKRKQKVDNNTQKEDQEGKPISTEKASSENPAETDLNPKPVIVNKVDSVESKLAEPKRISDKSTKTLSEMKDPTSNEVLLLKKKQLQLQQQLQKQESSLRDKINSLKKMINENKTVYSTPETPLKKINETDPNVERSIKDSNVENRTKGIRNPSQNESNSKENEKCDEGNVEEVDNEKSSPGVEHLRQFDEEEEEENDSDEEIDEETLRKYDPSQDY